MNEREYWLWLKLTLFLIEINFNNIWKWNNYYYTTYKVSNDWTCFNFLFLIDHPSFQLTIVLSKADIRDFSSFRGRTFESVTLIKSFNPPWIWLNYLNNRSPNSTMDVDLDQEMPSSSSSSKEKKRWIAYIFFVNWYKIKRAFQRKLRNVLFSSPFCFA